MFILYVIFVGLVTFHILTRYSRSGRLINKIPGPTPLPIIGNLLQLNVSPVGLFTVMRNLAKNYPIVKVWYCTSAMVGLKNPDDLEILLSSQRAIQKSYIYGYIEPWLKTGLLTSTGQKWRQRRKMLTPAFHFQILQKYLDITGEQTDILINKLKQEGSVTIQNLLPLTSSITLNIICETTMGVSLNKLDTQVVYKYSKAIHNFGSVVAERSVKPYVLDWMMCQLIRLGRIQIGALKVLHKFTDNVLKNRREYHAMTNNKYLQEFDSDVDKNVNNDVRSESKKRLAMLDLLLLNEKKGIIDEEGIKEELDTFIFEGHDTSGMALFFTLMLLAENKNAQDKARDEVCEAIRNNKGKEKASYLHELPYIERCIKETLRLYPSVPTILRHLTEDLHLKNYVIPAGTDVVCFLYDLHRDPLIWPEPEKFDPDRFLPENIVKRHTFAYLPFSAGPRNCIGQKFAMQELKSVISQILYNFYLEPIDRTADITFTVDLVLRPTNPVRLKFIKINH